MYVYAYFVYFAISRPETGVRKTYFMIMELKLCSKLRNIDRNNLVQNTSFTHNVYMNYTTTLKFVIEINKRPPWKFCQKLVSVHHGISVHPKLSPEKNF